MNDGQSHRKRERGGKRDEIKHKKSKTFVPNSARNGTCFLIGLALSSVYYK